MRSGLPSGAAAARAFADAGARVVLIARSGEAIAALAGELGATRALAVPCDVTRYWEMAAAVDAAVATFGRLDVLVNNAGVAPKVRADMLETTAESFDWVLDVNLRGPFFLTQAVAKWMLEQRAVHGASLRLHADFAARGASPTSRARRHEPGWPPWNESLLRACARSC